MSDLPNEIKLSPHARERLEQRKNTNIKYNMQNIMESSVKWYGKEDLIFDCALYRHSCYTTRQSNQVCYITDGNIEIIYNKDTHVAITVLEVKDKFKPISQFLKVSDTVTPSIKEKEFIICNDCGKKVEKVKDGICIKCTRRKANMKARGKAYIRYLDLSDEEKWRIDRAIEGQNKRHEKPVEPEPELTVPNNNNYYSSKANQSKIETHSMIKPIQKGFNPLSDKNTFIKILKEYNCAIPTEKLEDILDTLIKTNEIKQLFEILFQNDSQQVLLDLEKTLNDVEKQLQYKWECDGFQEIDDIKFKGFLVWRKILNEAILFWKQLYKIN